MKHSNTRSVAQGTLAMSVVEKSLSTKSFMVRSASTWNSVPVEIRNIQKLESFKRKLKEWIKINVDIE